MRRRTFTAVLAGTAAWPLAARAQASMPVIGFLHSAAPGPFAHLVAAFARGLNEAGLVAGRNIAIDHRWAENRYDLLPALAAELVRRRVAVIVAGGGNVAALAAKAATTTIPIIFTAAAEPVRAGLVASLNRPGGNVTGIAYVSIELDGKRIELLEELVPRLVLVGVLVNPYRPQAENQVRDIEAAARALGRRIVILRAGTEREIEAVFASLAEQRIGALMVATDPFFVGHRHSIVALAARHAVPTIYILRDFVTAGGLISYGMSLTECYRQAGVYTARIIEGAKPAELPVMQTTKFELVINLRSAKALGIVLTEAMLSRADEVIE